MVGYLLSKKTKVYYYDFNIAEIVNICVSENCRGQGIGSKLMESFEAYYNKLGINHFILNADFCNTIGKRFYEKLGYKKEK